MTSIRIEMIYYLVKFYSRIRIKDKDDKFKVSKDITKINDIEINLNFEGHILSELDPRGK